MGVVCGVYEGYLKPRLSRKILVDNSLAYVGRNVIFQTKCIRKITAPHKQLYYSDVVRNLSEKKQLLEMHHTHMLKLEFEEQFMAYPPSLADLAPLTSIQPFIYLETFVIDKSSESSEKFTDTVDVYLGPSRMIFWDGICSLEKRSLGNNQKVIYLITYSPRNPKRTLMYCC